MRSGAFWAGLITGAVVGAAIALVYAPRPGDETRQSMSQGVRNFADVAKKRGLAMFQRGRGKGEEAGESDVEEAAG